MTPAHPQENAPHWNPLAGAPGPAEELRDLAARAKASAACAGHAPGLPPILGARVP